LNQIVTLKTTISLTPANPPQIQTKSHLFGSRYVIGKFDTNKISLWWWHHVFTRAGKTSTDHGSIYPSTI